jgi:hypothetical protein
MNRIFLAMALTMAGGGVAAAPPAMAAAPDMPAAGGRPTAMHAQEACLPLVRDYFWLDYARMGMGMNMGGSRNGNASAAGRDRAEGNGQSGNRGWSRRTRLVHLRHNGFPPPERSGCPACGQAEGRRKEARAAGTAARPSLKARRDRRDGRYDADIARAVIWLETPDNLIHRIDPGRPGSLRFNARMWGQYRVFAHIDQGERNGVRRLAYAFLELFSHGDDVSPKQRPVLNGNGYWQGQPEFHLQRVYENDRQRYRTQTGEEAKFRLTFRGQPVKGACVVMITQKDWRQARRTDENGEASFFLIKETPNESGWRARRRSEKYLVVARHFVPASEGQEGLKGTQYVATQLLRVRPSRLEWESKSTAFLLASFTAVAAGAAIAIRRVRRRRHAREGGK